MAMLTVERLHPDFGARISGVDLREPLSDAAREEIMAAIDEYSFLCFPDQPFDDERQLALTRRIGEPEPSHVALGQEGRIEYFGTIGNVQPDGTALGNSHKKTVFLTGNNMWHSDASFKKVPAFVSIMCAYEVPAEDGLTQFVSTRAAYDRLSDDRKAEVDPLVVIHDYVYSRSKVAPDAVSPSQIRRPQPLHRLARALHRGVERSGQPGAPGRPRRPGYGRGAHIRAFLAAGRSGDLGQSLPAAPRNGV